MPKIYSPFTSAPHSPQQSVWNVAYNRRKRYSLLMFVQNSDINRIECSEFLTDETQRTVCLEAIFRVQLIVWQEIRNPSPINRLWRCCNLFDSMKLFQCSNRFQSHKMRTLYCIGVKCSNTLIRFLVEYSAAIKAQKHLLFLVICTNHI